MNVLLYKTRLHCSKFRSNHACLPLQVKGLYKGLTSPLYGIAFINAIVFGVEGAVHRHMRDKTSLWSHFRSGALAGLAQTVICSPMELAKTRMQVQGQGESRLRFAHVRHAYTGPVDCLVKIFRAEGVRGVFRGLTITACREAPSFGVYFCSYEYLCRLLVRIGATATPPAANANSDPQLHHHLSIPMLLVAGGMAGICAWVSTYPIDVIKSRVQADMTNKYTGFWDCCRKSYGEMGVAVFTRGLGSTVLRAFPVNAATFGVVSLILRSCNVPSDDDGSYDWSMYVLRNYPDATLHLSHIANFPSCP